MRLRWLNVQWPMDIWSLAHKMQEKRFTKDTAVGFMIDKVRTSYLEGRFVECIKSTQSVVDPLGNQVTFERTEYKIINFRACLEPLGLELLDPPRGLETFFAVLSEVCSFEFFFQSISVDALGWYLALDISLRDVLDIETLQVGDVSVYEGVRANVLLIGRGDIRRAAEAVAGHVQFRSDKLKARSTRSPRFAFVLSRHGQASLLGQPPLKMLDQLRTALRAAIN